MVLGVCPLLKITYILCTNGFLDRPLQMARSTSNPGRYYRHCWIFSGACPRWAAICTQHPRFLRFYPHGHSRRSGCFRRLPEITPGKGHSCSASNICYQGARVLWQSLARCELGANAFWRHHCPGILQRGPSRPVSCAFHHGKRIHRLRNHSHNYTARRPSLA